MTGVVCPRAPKCFKSTNEPRLPECDHPDCPGKPETFFHMRRDPNECDHEFSGWRAFPDGNGGEQVCKKCGMGAMEHSLRTES